MRKKNFHVPFIKNDVSVKKITNPKMQHHVKNSRVSFVRLHIL